MVYICLECRIKIIVKVRIIVRQQNNADENNFPRETGNPSENDGKELFFYLQKVFNFTYSHISLLIYSLLYQHLIIYLLFPRPWRLGGSSRLHYA